MTDPIPVDRLLLYCRAGFEKECAAEICDLGERLGVPGHARTRPDSAFVVFVPHDGDAAALFIRLRYRHLIFARQLLGVVAELPELPVGDRINPLLAAARSVGHRFGALLLETADTNEAKELSAFCRKFEKPFASVLGKAGLLTADPALPRLHVFFQGSAHALVAVSDPANSSPWPLGIPRLRMPHAAPSRSTLKLAEAILHFDLDERFAEGQTAVDLGAAPGGWTWQLTQRGLHVSAIDNGPMDKALLATGLVEHLRADGFHYQPKRAVHWLVCDMIEKPERIARLIADWIAEGKAQQAVFNLKLPMKKRYDEVQRCRELIATRLDTARMGYRLACRQLYHDREEITAFLMPLPH
jgi:23S rRNA (cytidine2498-2'-O)-methyltransferase